MKDLKKIFEMCEDSVEVLAMLIVLLVLFTALQIAFMGAGLLFGFMAIPTFLGILLAGARIYSKIEKK